MSSIKELMVCQAFPVKAGLDNYLNELEKSTDDYIISESAKKLFAEINAINKKYGFSNQKNSKGLPVGLASFDNKVGPTIYKSVPDSLDFVDKSNLSNKAINVGSLEDPFSSFSFENKIVLSYYFEAKNPKEKRGGRNYYSLIIQPNTPRIDFYSAQGMLALISKEYKSVLEKYYEVV